MRKKVLTKREKEALGRAAYMKRAALVIEGFIHKSSFSSVDAVTSIAQHYYPDLTKDNIFNFWNIRRMNQDVLDKLEKVLDFLKVE